MTSLLLYQRIAQQLAEDIRRGVYQPGERVPSVRKMSSQLNVSHATVLQAYANLEDQGLIRARPQSGYYVHQTPALTAPTPDIARVERPGLVTRASIIQQVLVESRREGVFPLGAAVPHVDYLPVRALHQQIAKVTRFHSPRAFSYMFSPGFEPLRRQVAIRMRDAGVVVDPSEVVITHGCVDALQMSLRVLTRPGDLIAAESPTYYGLLQLADLLGLKVIEIPSDPSTGISLEALQLAANQWSIKALVLTPRLSNPLGGTMPEERMKQLLRLASDFDIQIVEDDIYGELMFDQGKTKALKAYDRLGHVVYCSSFSKTLSPGVRIGWMIPGKYQAEIQRLQTFSTHSACSVTQMGIASYLENGGYDRHLRYSPRIPQEPQRLSAGGAAVLSGGYADYPAAWRLHSVGEPAWAGQYPGIARACAGAGHQHRPGADLQQHRAVQPLHSPQLRYSLEQRGGKGADDPGHAGRAVMSGSGQRPVLLTLYLLPVAGGLPARPLTGSIEACTATSACVYECAALYWTDRAVPGIRPRLCSTDSPGLYPAAGRAGGHRWRACEKAGETGGAGKKTGRQGQACEKTGGCQEQKP